MDASLILPKYISLTLSSKAEIRVALQNGSTECEPKKKCDGIQMKNESTGLNVA